MMSPERYVQENVRKKLTMLGLWSHVATIGAVTHDRVIFTCRASILPRLGELLLDRAMSRDPVWTISHAHDLAKRFYSAQLGPLRNPRSWRERRRPPLQVVLHDGPVGSSGEWLYGDADIDLSSWSMDVVGVVTHIVEILTPGPTNHRQLARRIDRDYREWREREA
jgi:hypothetical protein